METVLAKRQNKKGFTLVELVIVIAVLAILAAIAIPTVTNVINSANANVDASNAQTIELALKSSYAEATAGTWKDANDKAMDPAAITVDQALTHQGLSADILTKLKESGKIFVYTANGKIIADNSTPTTGNTALTSGSTVKVVLGTSAAD